MFCSLKYDRSILDDDDGDHFSSLLSSRGGEALGFTSALASFLGGDANSGVGLMLKQAAHLAAEFGLLKEHCSQVQWPVGGKTLRIHCVQSCGGYLGYSWCFGVIWCGEVNTKAKSNFLPPADDERMDGGCK